MGRHSLREKGWAKMNDLSQTGKPAANQQLLSFLRQLAGDKNVLEITEVRSHFSSKAALITLNKQLITLEELGLVERIFGHSGRQGRPPLVQVRLLQADVSASKSDVGDKPVVSTRAQTESAKPEQTKLAAQPTLPSAPQSKPLPVPAPPVSQPVVSGGNAQLGAVVFIDENQLIGLEMEGRRFVFHPILDKIKRETGQNVERVFVYYSEATERRYLSMAQSLFQQDSPILRLMKIGSKKDMADRRIREDIALWSRINLVSTIVLGTSDGGQDFLEAIDTIKNSGKKFVLLKTGRNFNSKLRQLADSLIDVETISMLRRPFEKIILEAVQGEFDSHDLNSRFVLAIVMGVKGFFNSVRVAEHLEIFQGIRVVIRARREFDGFTDQDIHEAMHMLRQIGQLFIYRKLESGRSAYHLSFNCALLRVLERFFPALAQA